MTITTTITTSAFSSWQRARQAAKLARQELDVATLKYLQARGPCPDAELVDRAARLQAQAATKMRAALDDMDATCRRIRHSLGGVDLVLRVARHRAKLIAR